ncbi:MAG: FAD-dependent oxidoreductase, partial [Deltaproteobacteria bacterium]
MDLAGEDSAGVVQAVSFLRNAALNREMKVGRSVAVIGGGNAALDAARTSLRLGAENVSILYRRTRAEMPAWEEEIEAALEEGIEIKFLVAPVEVVHENGTITGLKCINMELGEPDQSGRRRPVPIQGTEFLFATDMVISAIGQQIDPEFWNQTGGLMSSSGNTIHADPLTCETNIEGVFAGGDAVSGPATVVEAVGAGHEAAISISRFLADQDVRAGRTGRSRDERKKRAQAYVYPPIPKMHEEPRQQPMCIQVNERVTNFNEVEHALSVEAAAKEAERCLNCGLCAECMECVRACPAHAVNHSIKDEVAEVRVGAVILAPGFTTGDPAALKEYGHGRLPNVVTGLEFERMLSASGPSGGHLQRLSDGRIPRKIAFIQCVGSRDVRFKPYCSSVCCIYAVKEAVIAREHTPGLETHIFYMDLRAFGKEFEDYCTRARDEYGVLFSRSRVAGLEETDGHDLIVRFEKDGRSAEEVFDLVVLSTGLDPPADNTELADVFDIELNEFGFART